MAMNKAEQAEMARLRQEVALARALSWPSYGEPAMMQPPEAGEAGVYISGWVANCHAGMDGANPLRGVTPAWSGSGLHRLGAQEPKSGETARQRGIPLYETKVDALRGLRLQATLRCAEILAGIDAAIAAAEGEG